MSRISENTEAVACFLHQRTDREKERKQRELERVKTKRWKGKKRKEGSKDRREEREETQKKRKRTSSLPRPSTPLYDTSNSDDSNSDPVVCTMSVHLNLWCVQCQFT